LKGYVPPDYFGHSNKFLGLVEAIINQMIVSGNKVFRTVALEPNETRNERHKKAAQWDDLNIAIPTLFNFYHGIELTLKGMLSSIEALTNQCKQTHDLNFILKELKCKSKVDPEFSNFIKKYTGIENQFKPLFNSNQITGNQFYDIFKYPENKKGKQFNYNPITQQEELSLLMFKEVIDDISLFDSLRTKWWQNNQDHIL
jgi:hypothetical protein